MEDWQGCLAPQCQTALLSARKDVDHRGGAVITVEDFLLALLDSSLSARQFLRGSGVDMDEFIRTIQCEQPIVTEVGGEGLLSSQLIYWVATARETFGTPVWLDWPQLLEVLAKHTERLQEKAYVAVLERVSRWPDSSDQLNKEESCTKQNVEEEVTPIVVTDTAWAELAEDVAITLAATPTALVWVRGDRGAGKSTWLRSLLSLLTQPYVEIDLRCEAGLMAREHAVIPPTGKKHRSVLVLDNVTPSALQVLMDHPSGLVYELVQQWQGPLVLLGSEDQCGAAESYRALEHRLGRALEIHETPPTSEMQRKAILVAHQAAIERRWNIHLSQPVIEFAASRRSRCVCAPGGMLQWVERAAARLELFARRGPVNSVALSGQAETLRRQSLVALARQEPLGEIEQSLADVQLLRAATEVDWYERKTAGTLRQLTVEDLRFELERWLAARPGPVHYEQLSDHQYGESASAGS